MGTNFRPSSPKKLVLFIEKMKRHISENIFYSRRRTTFILLITILLLLEAFSIPSNTRPDTTSFLVPWLTKLPPRLPDHNIDINPLNRSATLFPDPKFQKIGYKLAISSDSELCNNLTKVEVFEKFEGKANAADAAVTLGLCLGMVNFFNSGIGGGGYVTYADGSGNQGHISIDFRELSPLLTDESLFTEDYMSKVGGLSIAIPGELLGLYQLHKLRGSGLVSWSELLDPVIKLGKEGWIVEEVLDATLQLYEPTFMQLKEDWLFVFDESKTRVLRKGERIKRTELAAMLDVLAKNGSVAPFYDPDHWIVKSMVKSIRKYGGIATPEDFQRYRTEVMAPLSVKLEGDTRNLTVLTSGGTSSGAALISALKILDRFPSVPEGDYLPGTSFQLVEAMKWMASARTRLGDSAPKQNQYFVMSDDWARNATKIIKDNSVFNATTNKMQYTTLSNWSSYGALYQLNEPHGTAHFSIVDPFGNAVSLTTTINLLFGSLIHDPGTGVIFNDEMDDFAQLNRTNSFNLTASKYNLIKPMKRPLSSSAPTVILDSEGRVDLVVGASGGSRITPTILQSIIRTYWYNMPLLETVAYPRVHHQLLPDQLEAESLALLGKEVVENFKEMGYTVVQRVPKSVVNAIRRSQGKNGASDSWIAVSDYWRKRGISAVL